MPRSGRISRVLVVPGAVAAVAVALLVPGGSPAADPTPLPVVNPTIPAARDAEPVVLQGSAFPGWSVSSNFTFKLPIVDLFTCVPKYDPNSGSQVPFNTDSGTCPHNDYATPEFDSQRYAPQEGTPVERLLGYRWDATKHTFVQIPFQVDEVFTRYLDNAASGFAFYSGDDQHTTYAFDREGFRYTKSDPSDPCKAVATSPAMADPVRGLDSNDELAFMAGDAGDQAPSDAPLPAGIKDARRVAIADPSNPTAGFRFAYVMRAKPDGPKPAFTAANGYVHYQRDPGADTFERSVSNYSNYGNAAVGPYCDAQGHLVTNADGTPKLDRRRPQDHATVTTPRYSFHYSGRWLMDSLKISPDDGKTYGPDLLDRWKARAFAQDPGSKTPCCGFEEEETNWGGSSTLMGERVGPVRAIRETWGADSGTNVVRRETFYRNEIRQKTWLRVHPIPPLDGIYSQWDWNAGKITKFYTPKRTDGLNVDGRNDEAYGNLDDPCNAHYDDSNYGPDQGNTQGYRSAYRQLQLCKVSPYHQSVDLPDLTVSDANAALAWGVTAGPFGSIVDRYQIDHFTDLTPGGSAQTLLAAPYYRDDSCFDDGTGSDPGPKLKPRGDISGELIAPDGTRRRCWAPGDGDPNGNPHFFQGSIGTHGLHLLMVAESDNARQTVPLTEIVAEQRLVMLPGQQNATAGERYGRDFEKPLVAAVAPDLGGVSVPLPSLSSLLGVLGAGGSGSGAGSGGSAGGAPPATGPGDQTVQPSGDTSAQNGEPAPAGQPTPAKPGAKRHPLRVHGSIGRRTRVRDNRFTVGCRASGDELRACLVRAFAGRTQIGRGFTRMKPGSRRVAVVLNATGRRLLRRHPKGLRVRIVVAAVPRSGLGRVATLGTTLRR